MLRLNSIHRGYVLEVHDYVLNARFQTVTKRNLLLEPYKSLHVVFSRTQSGDNFNPLQIVTSYVNESEENYICPKVLL